MEPEKNSTVDSQKESLAGVTCASLAFLIWGFSPIYWKFLDQVPSLEIIMHRVVWSTLCLFIMMSMKGKLRELISILKKIQTYLVLIPTAILIILNWLFYVWAINHDHILQASLGYFISPLINIFLGMLFLKERLNLIQTVALLLVGFGVLNLVVFYGAFPWIAFSIAFSFGLYSLIRKIAPYGPLIGLSVEVTFLFVPALVYLMVCRHAESGAFLNSGSQINFLLFGTGLLTILPLLLYTMSTKYLSLSVVGFLQYIAPSCKFFIAIFLYREPLLNSQLLTFILIWTALALCSMDSIRNYHRK